LNTVHNAFSNVAAATVGSWLLSVHKTLWMLCCMYSKIRQEILPYLSADKQTCHHTMKNSAKHI